MSSPIQRARSVLDGYANAYFPAEELAEDPETVISDLIADLRHYCERRHLDFERCVELSEFHYSDEANTEEAA